MSARIDPQLWVRWLELEYEAVWIYPVIGARVSELRDAALEQFEAHRERRDVLIERLTQGRTSVPEPQPAYAIGPITGQPEADLAAQSIEQRITSATGALVAGSTGDDRAMVLEAMRTSAVNQVVWGGKVEPFPGLNLEQSVSPETPAN